MPIENSTNITTPRIVFETAAIKASMPESDFDLGALTARVSELEREVERLRSCGVSPKTDGESTVVKAVADAAKETDAEKETKELKAEGAPVKDGASPKEGAENRPAEKPETDERASP